MMLDPIKVFDLPSGAISGNVIIFIILQLLFFIDVSSNKHKTFESQALADKPPNSVEQLRRKT